MTRMSLFASAAFNALIAAPVLAGAPNADEVAAGARPIACDELTPAALGLEGEG